MAAITYFLKLGHNNHGLHIYRSDTGPPTGRRNNGPSMGRMIDWPNMGQTDRIMAVNGLELESSVHGPTITGHR